MMEDIYDEQFDLTPYYQAQLDLKNKVIDHDEFADPIQYIAGADVAYDEDNNRMVGALVLLNAITLEVVESVYHEMEITFPYVPGFLNEITDKFYIGMLSMTPFQKAKKTPNLQCLHSARTKTYSKKRRKWVFKHFLHQLQSEPETIGEGGENRVFNPKREKMDEAINHDREGRHLKLSAWNGPHFLHSPVYSKMEIIIALEFELW